MRAGGISLGLAVLLVVTGCGVHRDEAGTAVVEYGYPIEAADLSLGVTNSLPDAELRHLVQELVDVEGVRLIEADYGTRSLEVLFEPSLNASQRQRLVDRLASWPGLSTITPGSPAPSPADASRR